MYKKITALFLVIVLICIPISIKAASQSVEIYINGKRISSDVPPVITEGRILVPLRVVSENLGAKVHWDNSSKTVTIKGSKNIILTVNNRNILVDNNNIVVDVPASVVQNRTMVPLRFISEVLESKVDWDNTEKRVTITKTQGDIVKFFYEKIEENPVIVVSGDAPLKYNISEYNEDQLAIDIKGGIKTSNNTIYANDGVLKKAIIGKIQDESLLSRLIIDFDLQTKYKIKESSDKKTIYIYLYSANSIEDIKLRSKIDELQATIKTTKYSNINYFTLQNPARFVLDINDALLNEKDIEMIPENDFITDVRTSQFSKDPNVVRVVFDLTDSKVKYSINNKSSKIEIEFYRLDDSKEVIIQNPTDYNGKIVVIDPGHGGSDPGAVRNGVTEKFLNLDIGLKLRNILEEKDINVLMTRDKDIFVDLYVRAGIANDVGADAFVSIHSNTASAVGATGIETLYYPDTENKKLALSIQNAVAERTGFTNRGIVQRPRLVVTRETKMPSALVEVGFMSNPSDLALLLDEDFRQRVAEGIATGIINFLSGQTD